MWVYVWVCGGGGGGQGIGGAVKNTHLFTMHVQTMCARGERGLHHGTLPLALPFKASSATNSKLENSCPRMIAFYEFWRK